VKITPLDIRRKEFKRSMRGYSDEEVDIFLDEVADEFERVFQENMELNDRVQRLDEQIASHMQLKDALEKTLISAQLQAEELRANAHKESELILRDAEMKARGIVSDSYGETQRTQQTLAQLKLLEEDFRFKFRSLLEGYLRLLSQAPLGAAAAEPELPAAAEPELPAAAEPELPAAAEPELPLPAAAMAESRFESAAFTPPSTGTPAREAAVISGWEAADVHGDPAPSPDPGGAGGWKEDDDTLDDAVTLETPTLETGPADTFAFDMVGPEQVEEPASPSAASSQDAPQPEEQTPRGFFFGRRLEDVDDTFAGEDDSKREQTRDFEW
jgi:cell division initiation protein